MKFKKSKLLLQTPLVMLAALVFSGGLALAVGGSSVVTTTSPIKTPADPQATTTIEQRIAQRKAAAQLKQSPARAQQITAKCSLAQIAIGELRTKDTKIRVQRNQAYTTLATRLNNIVINLGNQGVNASDLHAKQKLFNDAINKYLATAMDYKTAVDDLVNMDCKADSSGFEATLIQVRNLRKQLKQDATAVREQLPQLLKSLNDIKKHLRTNTVQS